MFMKVFEHVLPCKGFGFIDAIKDFFCVWLWVHRCNKIGLGTCDIKVDQKICIQTSVCISPMFAYYNFQPNLLNCDTKGLLLVLLPAMFFIFKCFQIDKFYWCSCRYVHDALRPDPAVVWQITDGAILPAPSCGKSRHGEQDSNCLCDQILFPLRCSALGSLLFSFTLFCHSDTDGERIDVAPLVWACCQ